MTLPEKVSSDSDGEGIETDGNLDRDELLARAVVRLAEEHDVDVPDAETIEELDRRVDDLAHVDAVADLRADVEELEDEVETLRSALDEDIEDVRGRVVEVLKKVQSKAAEDHSHPQLVSSLETVREDMTRIEDRVDRLDARLEEGTGSVESALAEYEETVDDVEEKLTKLAGATVRLQRRLGTLETERAKRDGAAELATVANRHGVTDADCEDCGNTVHVGLLAAPQCPHCESHFESVEPKSGFFGSATLIVGRRPALEGEAEPPTDPDDLFEDES